MTKKRTDSQTVLQAAWARKTGALYQRCMIEGSVSPHKVIVGLQQMIEGRFSIDGETAIRHMVSRLRNVDVPSMETWIGAGVEVDLDRFTSDGCGMILLKKGMRSSSEVIELMRDRGYEPAEPERLLAYLVDRWHEEGMCTLFVSLVPQGIQCDERSRSIVCGVNAQNFRLHLNVMPIYETWRWDTESVMFSYKRITT